MIKSIYISTKGAIVHFEEAIRIPELSKIKRKRFFLPEVYRIQDVYRIIYKLTSYTAHDVDNVIIIRKIAIRRQPEVYWKILKVASRRKRNFAKTVHTF